MESAEQEYPPLDINIEALLHIASNFLPGNHGICMGVSSLNPGTFHEIRLLHFADGFKAITRFKRNTQQSLEYMRSDYATMEFVRGLSSVRVPEIYYVNFNSNHVVGAAFAIMEFLEGRELYWFVEELSFENRKEVVRQWAEIIVELSKLRADVIGSLTTAQGGMGKVQDWEYGEDSHGRGPFRGIMTYIQDLMAMYTTDDEELKAVTEEAEAKVLAFFRGRRRRRREFEKPFRLMHRDLNPQNMLFIYDEDRPEVPPKLSGVIDWDGATALPLYYLLEYPIFIKDSHSDPKVHGDNVELRRFFEEAVVEGCEDEEGLIREAFEKCVLMDDVVKVFPWKLEDEGREVEEIRRFLRDVEGEEKGKRVEEGGEEM